MLLLLDIVNLYLYLMLHISQTQKRFVNDLKLKQNFLTSTQVKRPLQAKKKTTYLQEKKNFKRRSRNKNAQIYRKIFQKGTKNLFIIGK